MSFFTAECLCEDTCCSAKHVAIYFNDICIALWQGTHVVLYDSLSETFMVAQIHVGQAA